jgi:Zn-dependent protease
VSEREYETERRQEPLDWEPLLGTSGGDEDPHRDYEPVQPESAWRSLARKLAAPFIALGILLWKLKFLFAALFKFKIFTTSASMLVSVAAYAWIWGWKFAVGFVLLLFVHELGHVLELRRQGVPASAPLFIPFLGAVVGMNQMPKNARKEAQVALAGPILGSLGAAAVWGVGEAYDSDLLVALAFTGFLLNLFNLLPVLPLDGGRVVAALHPALWAVGFAALVVLTIFFPNPILVLVIVIGGLELWRRWRERAQPGGRAYYELAAGQRIAVAVTYIGLAVALGLAMSATHIERDL